MQQLVLTNVNDTVLNGLQERAARHGRTPEQEATAILEDALRNPCADDWEKVDAIYDRLAASGQSFSDSAELLREDRDR